MEDPSTNRIPQIASWQGAKGNLQAVVFQNRQGGQKRCEGCANIGSQCHWKHLMHLGRHSKHKVYLVWDIPIFHFTSITMRIVRMFKSISCISASQTNFWKMYGNDCQLLSSEMIRIHLWKKKTIIWSSQPNWERFMLIGGTMVKTTQSDISHQPLPLVSFLWIRGGDLLLEDLWWQCKFKLAFSKKGLFSSKVVPFSASKSLKKLQWSVTCYITPLTRNPRHR